MDGAVFPLCWLFDLRCSSTRACRLLSGARSWGEMAASQGGAHKNEYSQELPLPVNLSPQCDSHPLPPQEAFQYWHGDLAQSLIRSLLFSPDPGMHRTLCVPSRSGVSTSPSLWNSCYQTLLAFKARFSGGFSHCQTPKLGTWCGAQDFDSCGRTSVV